jgi:ParB family chromosome partitioning protein
MTERRRGLGRGLGALIPAGPEPGANRPVDVFFPQSAGTATAVLDPPTATSRGDWRSAAASDGGSGSGDVEHGGTALDDVVPDSPEGLEHHDPNRQGHGPGGATHEDAMRSPEPPQASTEHHQGLVPVPGARFAELPVDSIEPNHRQPRQVFDEDDLEELVDSIRAVGVLQPIVVRPSDGPGRHSYELIMGERRWRAAQLAGLTAVPAIVRSTPDSDMLRDALLENLHRAQLNPLEEAAAYQQLLEDFACTHEQLASRVARSRPQISNTIRLLRLPATVQRRVAAGVLSAGHARAVLSLSDPDAQERLAQRVVAEGLSVRATEEIVALGEDLRRPEPRRRAPSPIDTGRLDELAARLSDHLDTRVRIDVGQRKGRIAIEFATVDDLDRILGVLSPAAGSHGSAGGGAAG